MTILNLGTYPPKQCGIATFSKDLRDNLLKAGQKVYAAAVSDGTYSYVYPSEVVWRIRQERKGDYIKAAKLINNARNIKVVLIQHEYGIYGGTDGDYLLKFTFHLRKPFILVTHTVLPRPSSGQRNVLTRLCQKAAGIVCMTSRSSELLARVYQAPPDKITVIHHGVPIFAEQDRENLKKRYGFQGRQLVTTFGLIGPGKGLENGIRALAMIADKHPDALYLIAGGTHPMLLKKEGDRYRQMLVKLVSDLGLERQVKFINHFLELDELGDYLYMTDLYLSPYPNRDQAVSGTLSYAVGCGRAIVATPYEHALELLGEGRGLISDDMMPESLAKLMDRVLSDADLKASLENRAREFGRNLQWPSIARLYVNLVYQILKTDRKEAEGEEEEIGHGL